MQSELNYPRLNCDVSITSVTNVVGSEEAPWRNSYRQLFLDRAAVNRTHPYRLTRFDGRTDRLFWRSSCSQENSLHKDRVMRQQANDSWLYPIRREQTARVNKSKSLDPCPFAGASKVTNEMYMIHTVHIFMMYNTLLTGCIWCNCNRKCGKFRHCREFLGYAYDAWNVTKLEISVI
jgi:hypothetical protein